MFRRSLILVLVFLAACTSAPKTSPLVKKFMKDWSELHPNKPKTYRQSYESYVATVEKQFTDSAKPQLFKPYLDSIINNSQIIAHKEMMLPTLYRKQKASLPRNMTYKMYEAKEISALQNRLFAEREAKLKQQLGLELFSEIKTVHQSHAKNQALDFPL